MTNENQTTTEIVNIDDMFAKIAKEQETVNTPEEKTAEEIVKDFFPEKESDDAPAPPPPHVEVPEQVNTDNNVYNKVIDYINNGFLDNTEIEIGEGEDVQKVFLSDLKDIDEDTLKFIIDEQKKNREEDLKEKYISTEGLDDRTKKMVELKKAGGDLTELIQEDVRYTNALSGLDIEDEVVQEGLVVQKLQSQGLHPKVIKAQIEAMKEDMTLDLEAKRIVSDYNAYYDKFIEDKKAEQLTIIEKQKEDNKEFRKNINQSLKDLKLPDNISKVILENSTKLDEFGLTNTDKLYFDSKKDAKLHAEISFFLNNRDEFQKFVELATKNKVTIEQVNKVIKINPKNIKTEVQAPKTDKDKNEDLLNNFFNK